MARYRRCRDMLKEFENTGIDVKGQKLEFKGVDQKDVYNITAPFNNDGTYILAGRVESRDSEFSQVMFFECKNGVWSRIEDYRVFDLQDPFIAKIKGELVFGGVKVWPNPKNKKKLLWKTVFYRGQNINDLEYFTEGPDGMKDIRLIEMKNGEIGVFTRPQGPVGGRGRIGFTTIKNLNELNAEVIEKAELIDNKLSPREWGGVNELHLLKNGSIGVLGHVACFDLIRHRHYYAVAFAFDPETRVPTPMKMIAARKNFEKGEVKRIDLRDVIFSGGLTRSDDGTADLYVGVSDAEAHKITIPDPFMEYEVC